MTSEEKMNDFISHAAEKFFFYIEEDFWSKPTMEEINNWLKNFDKIEEKYCAARLLDRFVFYSEKDLVRLMEFGLYEKIIKRYLLQEEKKNDFQLTNDDVQTLKNVIKEGLYFIPLQVRNLSESSLAMLRYLTVDLGFNEDKILDVNNLESNKLKNCTNIIIIDDFIGSGKQITDFWSFGQGRLDGNPILIHSLKDKFPSIDFEYFCLVCTEEGKSNFSENYEIGFRTDLRITFGEILDRKFKVFSNESTYFDSDEKEKCKNILQELCSRKNVELLGYKGLDYAVAFHHSIPDCSLPLFSTNSDQWNYLFKNKKTDSDEDF